MADTHDGAYGEGQGPSSGPMPPNPWANPDDSRDHWGYQQAVPVGAPQGQSWGAAPAPSSPPAQPEQPAHYGWAPSQPGWSGTLQPAPPPPPAAPAGGPEQPARRWPKAFLPAAFVATAVLFAGAGVAAGLALGNDGTLQASGRSVTLPTAAQSSPANGNKMSVAAIAAKVEKATVDITAKDPDGEGDEGTGMVLTSTGIVLTNNHVIAGSISLSAQVNGAGRSYRATVVGADPTDDVALLQLHGASNFHTVVLGNSSNINVGSQVVAIGNALALSGPETVTSGIISAVGRSVSVADPSSGLQEELKGVFQTSAPINPGNSGGPLVDSAGQVVGMNTASAQTTGDGESASNVGFAIPINKAMAIARQIQAGKASSTIIIGQRAIMGVSVVSVACAQGNGQGCPGGQNPFSNFFFGGGYNPPVKYGAVVYNVDQGSPAAGAGISIGDVIVSVDGAKVNTVSTLTGALAKLKVGNKVDIGWVNSRGTPSKATVTLIAGPNI